MPSLILTIGHLARQTSPNRSCVALPPPPSLHHYDPHLILEGFQTMRESTQDYSKLLWLHVLAQSFFSNLQPPPPRRRQKERKRRMKPLDSRVLIEHHGDDVMAGGVGRQRVWGRVRWSPLSWFRRSRRVYWTRRLMRISIPLLRIVRTVHLHRVNGDQTDADLDCKETGNTILLTVSIIGTIRVLLLLTGVSLASFLAGAFIFGHLGTFFGTSPLPPLDAPGHHWAGLTFRAQGFDVDSGSSPLLPTRSSSSSSPVSSSPPPVPHSSR